jgi:hypothetical protein
MRNQAVIAFGEALREYIVATGLLSDELTNANRIFASPGSGIANGGAVVDALDERILPQLPYGSAATYGSDVSYTRLQVVRSFVLQAIGQLAISDTSVKDTTVLKPSVNRALRAELHALYGYAELMLADLFCSGVPLSTVDFHKDFTYEPGSTTAKVYQDARAHFDTALVLAVDSVRIQHLARIGLARAYLNLASANPAFLVAAADDVSGVPTDYAYQLLEGVGRINGEAIPALNVFPGATVTTVDREGGNGLPYLSSHDPRTSDTAVFIGCGKSFSRTGCGSDSVFGGYPRVYLAGLSGSGYAPITVASGVEARLMEAEVALRRGDAPGWLTRLNQLRATAHIPGTPALPDSLVDTLGVTQCGGSFGTCGEGLGGGGNTPEFGQPAGGFPSLPDYTLAYTDTIPGAHTILAPDGGNVQDYCYSWSWYTPCYDGDTMVVQVYRRTGGSSSLAPLTDPGSDSARVALTFAERAAWLYMTGHRQGDLRRQLRQYRQYWPEQSRIYPTGAYPGFGAGRYGTYVTAPIPPAEYINPLFHGCLSRDP